MRLVFDHARIPRTTTRAEWREIDRWRRGTEAACRKADEQLFSYVGAFGSAALAEKLINPPICIYPPLEIH